MARVRRGPDEGHDDGRQPARPEHDEQGRERDPADDVEDEGRAVREQGNTDDEVALEPGASVPWPASAEPTCPCRPNPRLPIPSPRGRRRHADPALEP